MATFNILSSCICRDAFGFQTNCEHKVVTFLQSSSPVTWFVYNKKPQKLINMEMMDDVDSLYRFQKKCIVRDYNKEVLESYNEKADFFIMDLISLASTAVAEIEETGGEKHLFTYSKWFNRAYCDGLKKYLNGRIKRYNAVNFLKSHENVMEDTIDGIIDWLVNEKGYREDQVILVENKRVDSWSDARYLYYFDGKEARDRVNDMLGRAYDYFFKKMPNCHRIRMPFDTYSDKNHRWGLTELHFCKEFYDYLYQCFDLIAKEKSEDILELFYKYSELLINKKEILLKNSVKILEKKCLLRSNFNEGTADYIVDKGKIFYEKVEDMYVKRGLTKQAFSICEWDRIYSTIMVNGKRLYINSDDCEKGYVGHAQEIGKSLWKLQNNSTLVKVKNNSFVISNSGSSVMAQMQIISTIDNAEELKGKPLIFSVWARVLEQNDTGNGGQIAFINANDYNKGVFCAKESFSNTMWKKITVYYCVPEDDEFKGITVCMRALAGSSNKGKAAIVEFSEPKLEIGSLEI